MAIHDRSSWAEDSMGLIDWIRDKLSRETLRWECVDCGQVQRSNPERCSNCGSTILRQKATD